MSEQSYNHVKITTQQGRGIYVYGKGVLEEELYEAGEDKVP